MKHLQIGILGIIILLGIINFCSLKKDKIYKPKNDNNTEIILSYFVENVPDTVLSLRDSIKNEINKYNFKYPDIVFAQAILESANFKSNVFRTNNNMFGMRKANSRLTISKKGINNYAYYDHWIYSIVDRALYESTYLHAKCKDRQLYYKYLSQNYAEDSKYLTNLKRVLNTVDYY